MTTTSSWVVPKPRTMTWHHNNSLLFVDPCRLSIRVNGNPLPEKCTLEDCHLVDLISHYRQKHFRCEAFNESNAEVKLSIEIANTGLDKNYLVEDEQYELEVSKTGEASIKVDRYVGLVRAF